MGSSPSSAGVSERATARATPVAAFAWTATLVASNLPTIIWRIGTGAIVPIWLLAMQECVLLLLLLLIWLARLRGAVGATQALWLTALLFGVSHFYGNPSGYIGVALATWFGYLQAKNMEEARGSTWAYLLHFAQDVVIFSFVALAYVAAA